MNTIYTKLLFNIYHNLKSIMMSKVSDILDKQHGYFGSKVAV
ncbi:hypothetical protein BTN49_0200 [Candidatus Enterovibrio escicola]|uniref:Uncharacterized protein n=1 Tax=Candidatus Enterovibrio escicola TaxID=1927127 RepID=A0A2A5T7E0_9GAMM|nr:hypothetical protein [Candidatus Enterovibrio escacola]PCS24095.1 hypothetical protein BTN49_0200 [Candidatus Enterovibrio escacola]